MTRELNTSFFVPQDALEQALAQLNGRTPDEKSSRVGTVLLLTDGSHNESRFSFTNIEKLYSESKCSGIYW
jgi:hypothetical protein